MRIYHVGLYGFSLVRLLILILFRAILKQSINDKMVSKIEVGMYTMIFTYTNAKFIVICKPRLLMTVDEDSV